MALLTDMRLRVRCFGRCVFKTTNVSVIAAAIYLSCSCCWWWWCFVVVHVYVYVSAVVCNGGGGHGGCGGSGVVFIVVYNFCLDPVIRTANSSSNQQWNQ